MVRGVLIDTSIGSIGMDPAGVFSISQAAITLAGTAFKVCHELWDFIQHTKHVDQTVHDLQAGVKQVGDICRLIEKQTRKLCYSEPCEADEEELFIGVESQLRSCMEVVSRISSKIERVRQAKVSFAGQAYRQFQLNMSQDSIDACKSQIQSNILNLQLSFQLLNLQATHIAPKLANRALLDKLEEIQTLLTSDKHVDKRLHECADTYIARGNTLHESSVASTVGGMQHGANPEAIANWLEVVQALRNDENSSPPVPNDDDDIISANSQSQVTDETAATSLQERRPVSHDYSLLTEDDDDDDITGELIEAALLTGRTSFGKADYDEAEIRLGECLALIQTLPEHLRRNYDIDEIHLRLALCAFQIHNSETAEAALLSILDRNTSSVLHAELRFEAGSALATVYMRLKRYDLARLNCDNVYRGRRKLLGKQHDSCYESLAQLACIYDLQAQPARANTYRSVIPDDRKARLTAKYRQMASGTVSLTDNQAVAGKKPEEQWTDMVGGCRSLALSAPANKLACGLSKAPADRNARIELRSIPKCTLVHILKIESDTSASCLSFNSTGTCLASAHGGFWRVKGSAASQSKRLSIRVWDVSKGHLLYHFCNHGDQTDLCMRSLSYSLQNDRLLSTYDYPNKTTSTGTRQPGLVIQSSATGIVIYKNDCGSCMLRGFSTDGKQFMLSINTQAYIYNLDCCTKDQGPIGMWGGQFDKENTICWVGATGTITRRLDGQRPELWLKMVMPEDECRLQSMKFGFTAENKIIVSALSMDKDCCYLLAPQLGLWKAISDDNENSEITETRFSEDAVYVGYERRVDGKYQIQVLDVQEQLRSGRTITPATDISGTSL